MSQPVSAVVVAAGRSQRMGFDKLLTPLAGQPLLLHTLDCLQRTDLLAEIVLVIRPGSEGEIEPLLEPLRKKGTIRLVAGGAQRQDSVQAGLRAISEGSEFALIHDAARPFVTRELLDVVLEAARTSGAAACGHPCSDSLKEVSEGGVVTRTVDRAKLWAVQTPQIFRVNLLRDAYQAATDSNTLFTDDTAVVEQYGHPVNIVLYHGLNMKVTTPIDWKLAEAFLYFGETNEGPGQQLRKLLHDMNNHLTPLMGYSFMLLNEFPEDSRGKKFAANIQTASERCQQTAAEVQKIVRQLFPRKNND